MCGHEVRVSARTKRTGGRASGCSGHVRVPEEGDEHVRAASERARAVRMEQRAIVVQVEAAVARAVRPATAPQPQPRLRQHVVRLPDVDVASVRLEAARRRALGADSVVKRQAGTPLDGGPVRAGGKHARIGECGSAWSRGVRGWV